MILRELDGKRVELIQPNCWVASSGYVTAGNKGTVKMEDILPGCPMAHIVFDRVKARDGYLFGIGNANNEFGDSIQKWLKVIEED